ncbi:unnamed protein product [Rotaria socialis]|uniref:Hormone-sensitive lipase n=1 Tax=Rotaria socialis TaxID=392032 RepID=A0A818FIV4_9BILA|nr:unnamed protein product [Rotaria socialis]CAF4798131.1 unnamed protein product [Rotaria socialis]
MTNTAVPFPACEHRKYSFSITNSEELPSNDETTNSTPNYSSMSPVRSTESNENSSISSSFFKPITKHILSTRTDFKSSSSMPSSSDSSPKMRSSTTIPSDLNHLPKLQKQTSTAMTPTPETIDVNFNFDATYLQVRELAHINCNYFSQQKNDICRKFERLLTQLLHSLELTLPLIRYLIDNFHHFDYSPEIRANGYRTLVVSHGHACLRTLDILRQVDVKRAGILFNLMHSSKLFQDLNSWTKVLTSMQHMLSFAVKILGVTDKKSLYIDVTQVPMDIELDYFKIVAFDSENFFGSTCGFQFAQSLETMITFILAGLAAYHETYNRSIPFAAASLATAPKYILFPEQRAAKCGAIFRDCDYLFCKSFWNLVEHDFIKRGSRYIAPNVTVSKYFRIGPQPIVIDSIIIPPPTASADVDELNEPPAGNIGSGSDSPTSSGTMQSKQFVNIKLLSHEMREGMDKLPLKKSDFETSSKKILPMSDQLLMHIHGGGFIATSSTTHEVYLKPWALGLEIPIVSVDYSLAPEYPFPRAIEECFYAYAWILKNASKLGWTGKTLLLVGDSAGGNLITVVTIKAIEAGLRKPDGIICFYTPFLLRYSISPSRLMAVMDPLLNTGFLWRCLAAYTGIKSDDQLVSPTVSGNSTPEKQRKIDSTRASPNQIVSEEEDIPEPTKLEVKDIYHARLAEIMGSRQAYFLRKLRESPLPSHPHMSPLCASDDILRQFPTTHLVPCARDPFIDDNVEFARRLRTLNVPHHLVVVDEWPHGYLDYGFAANDLEQYNTGIMIMLQNIVQQSNR